ncbi:Os06g0624900, partial [Oryza sativa Japonica Group]
RGAGDGGDDGDEPGRRRWRRGDGGGAADGGGHGATVAAAAAVDELLCGVRVAPGAEQERVQPLLPRLHRRRPLRLLPPRPPRPPRRPDSEVVVPQRDQGVGGGEADRHIARADVRDQQRQDRVPQRPPAGEAREGRHQHLRDLLPQPPRLLPLLLPRLQAGRNAVGPKPDIRHPAEARAGLRRRRLRLRLRLLQPQEGEEGGGRLRSARPVRPGHDPVVRRRGQQVQHGADHADHAADQPVPAVEEEGHPPPCTLLRLAHTLHQPKKKLSPITSIY